MQRWSSAAIAADRPHPPLQIGLLAGLAGGLAEILWISAYAAGTHVKAATVARGVAEAIGLGGGATAVSLGILIHMALAGALGVAVVIAMQALPTRRRGWRIDLALILAALAGVWAFNFLVLLPVLSPGFTPMVPMPVSLVSKLLFGLATFVVLRMSEARADRRV